MASIIGSANLQISVANAEIVPNSPETWINVVYSFKEFDFLNDQDCHIIVDGADAIFLRANQGFKYSSEINRIKSFKIVEAGIGYNWLACY